MGSKTIHCYRERNILERNYSPSVDAFEDTLKELQETNQLDTNDDFKQAVHLEWYYRVFKAKTGFNGLDLIGEIYDDEPDSDTNCIRWNRAFITTGLLGNPITTDEMIRETMDIWAKQCPYPDNTQLLVQKT